MNVSKDHSCSRNGKKKENKQTLTWTIGRYLEDLRKPQIFQQTTKSFLLWQNAAILEKIKDQRKT